VKSADAVGRRIVKVVQKRCVSDYGKVYYDVMALVLDDGTRLVLSVIEMPDDYGIEINAYKP